RIALGAHVRGYRRVEAKVRGRVALDGRGPQYLQLLRAPEARSDLPDRAEPARFGHRAAGGGGVGDPPRGVRLSPEPGLELSVRAGRHLCLAVADQAVRFAHR